MYFSISDSNTYFFKHNIVSQGVLCVLLKKKERRKEIFLDYVGCQ